MNDANHVSKLSLDKLLLLIVDQGSGNARSELQRRKIDARLSLFDYIFRETLKIKGLAAVPIGSEHRLPAEQDDTDGIATEDGPDATCILARRMQRDGFKGQNMRDADRAAAYIAMAANNPCVEKELPPAGTAFWKSADFHYRMYKASAEALTS